MDITLVLFRLCGVDRGFLTPCFNHINGAVGLKRIKRTLMVTSGKVVADRGVLTPCFNHIETSVHSF